MSSRVKIILALASVVLLAIGGWFVYKNQHKTPAATVTPALPAVNPAFGKLPEGWITYENNSKGIRFAYPAAWGNFDPVAYRTPQYQNASTDLLGQLAVQFSSQQSTATGAPTAQIKGGTATDLGSTDANCIYSRWSVPLKSGNAVITIPSFCPQGGLLPDPSDSQQDYMQLKADFVNTIGVY